MLNNSVDFERDKCSDLFEQIFDRILKEATDKKLISSDHVFMDSTHLKASANKRKFEKKVVRKETKAYQDRLQKEINSDGDGHGKKPFSPDKFDKPKVRIIRS